MEEWEAVFGEELQCKREKLINPKDPYVVALVHKNVVVGHCLERFYKSTFTLSSGKAGFVVK